MLVKKIIVSASVFVMFFSWTSMRLNNFDSQVWPLLAGILVVLCVGKIYFPVFNRELALIFFLPGLLWSIVVSNGEPFYIFRSLFGYLTFFVIFTAIYEVYTRNLINLYHVTLLANITWLLGAFIQKFNPQFITYFGNPRLAENRGLTSFAPEPTFFGLQLILMTIILSYFVNKQNKKQIYFVAIINVLSIFLLAKSAMAVLYVAVGGLIFIGLRSMTNWKRFLEFLFLIILSTALIVVVKNSGALDGYRLLSLANKVMEIGPIEIITFDASINERIQHIAYSITGSFRNFFLPNGLDTFSAEWEHASPKLKEIFWYGKPDNKIMSWLGDWVYSFGLFGALSIICLTSIMKFGERTNNARVIFLIILLCSAIPIAHPLIPLILSLELAHKKGLSHELSKY